MIIEALNEYVEKMKRDMGDRTQTVGASEVGLCERRIWYSKRGRDHVPAVGSWGAYTRGTTMEEAFWYPAMRAHFGDKLVHAGPDQANIRLGQLSATPDGILTGLKKNALMHKGIRDIKSDCIMVECKSIDPRADLRKEKEEHLFQVQVQMGLVRDPKAVWFFRGKQFKPPRVFKPEYALISYTDASFWDEVEEFAIRYDPKVYAVAKVRAARIFGATESTELKPEGWITGGSECEYCPFNKPCGVDRRRVPTGEWKTPDPQFLAEIMDLCAEANRHRAVGDAETAKFKDYQDQIKNRLREKGIRKIPGVVSWSAVSGRTTYDMDKIREAVEGLGIDIADFAKHGAESDRLVIS